jgi:hypothetical protein
MMDASWLAQRRNNVHVALVTAWLRVKKAFIDKRATFVVLFNDTDAMDVCAMPPEYRSRSPATYCV